MTKIYTKTGDEGMTSLVSGTRVKKSEIRIDAYGEIDELNTRIGFLICVLEKKHFSYEIAFLQLIQSRMFDLGSQMACEEKKRVEYKLPTISSEVITKLEDNMDQMTNTLPPLKDFILPGGSEAGARAHLCRTSCRSAERKLISYQDATKEILPENSLIFLNRLSDYFFVLARYVNIKLNAHEIIWEKN